MAKIYCLPCDKIYEVEVKCVDELDKVICPQCKSEDIFFQDTGFYTDGKSVKMGRGGCGTVW